MKPDGVLPDLFPKSNLPAFIYTFSGVNDTFLTVIDMSIVILTSTD